MNVGSVMMRDREGQSHVASVCFEETGRKRAGVPSMHYVARWEGHAAAGSSVMDAGHALARVLGWGPEVFPSDGFAPAAPLSLGDTLWLRLLQAPAGAQSSALDALWSVVGATQDPVELERFAEAFRAIDGKARG